jgi:DNA-binding MarR family transcriptional regulator
VNSAFFSTKRAFHGVLRIVRRPMACFGLTAARFDMLYVLFDRIGHRCLQSEIRYALGVTAPTVSRMLGSLQELGLVTRHRWTGDGRQRVVQLTYEGISRMESAYHELVRSGATQLALDCALASPREHDRRACGATMRTLERLLWGMREQFGDSSWTPYRKLPTSILVRESYEGGFS